MDISKRLQTIADMVTRNAAVCDVGTDHGYLAIYLIEQQICEKVIAMDVAEGPLGKARTNIARYRLEDKIETRLSDGLDELHPSEADTVIMAGMGGILITSLLEKGKAVLDTVQELIVSPHTDVELVRRYLHQNGFAIAEERMLVEDGKYYIIMKAYHGRQSYDTLAEYRYGSCLLTKKNPILKKYLEKELKKAESLYGNLKNFSTSHSEKRRLELEEEIQCMKEGLGYYEMQ